MQAAQPGRVNEDEALPSTVRPKALRFSAHLQAECTDAGPAFSSIPEWVRNPGFQGSSNLRGTVRPDSGSSPMAISGRVHPWWR